MRKLITIVCIAGTVILLTVCLSSWKKVTDEPKTPSSKMGDAIRPDSVAISNLGTEEAKIIFSQNKASFFYLNPEKEPNDGDMRIGGILVVKKHGIVNEKNLAPLLFMLSDSNFATKFNNESNDVPTTNYAPTFALRFKGRKGQVDLLFSLSTNQMTVVMNGEAKKTLYYTPTRHVNRYFRNISGNELYDHYLTTEK